MINIISRNLNQPTLFLAGYTSKTKNRLQKLFLIQSNNICHKDDIDPEKLALRYPPFPYKEKRLNFLHKHLRIEGIHPTIGKFTENTKVLVVEGNVGSGKEELAKKLADDLGMKYFPDVTPELDYRTDDGFDFRDLNKHLHEDVWFPDFKTVLETRNPYQAAFWEMSILRMRTYNYLLALTHLLNTGDGVVLERSAWSGTVFARTLNSLNFFGKDFLEHYWEVRSAAFEFLHRPHIVIYLDVPIDECLENAKRKNKNDAGHLLNEEYLEHIENNYKKHLLPILDQHAEIFTYKSNKALTEQTAVELSELIVDELSESNMDEYYMKITSHQEKFQDWRFFDIDERWQNLRFEITNDKLNVLRKFNAYPFYVDELWPAYSLLFARDFVVENALNKREEKLFKGLSLREKIFGKKKTFEDRDTDQWFVKTGFPTDHLVGNYC